jgi:PAS domain S-box-containing protein
MSVTVILVTSILLQFATAFLALRLIRVTGRRTAWVLIAAALFFMAIRRCITLFQAEFLDVPYTTSMSAELVALVISILMLAGVIWIAPLFLSLKRSEEALRKARDELEKRVQERTASLTETNQRLEQEIAERKKAERALQESEEQYRDLYEESPDAYFSVGADGHIKRANRRAMELLGYSRDELIGRPVFDLYADTPNGKTKAQAVFQRFLAAEEIRDEELEMRRADGSKVWISLSVRPIRDKEGQVVASRSVVADITERKRMEEALRESEEDLNRAQAVAHTGSWRLDVRNNQLLWSDEVHRIFGIPKGMPMTYETFLASVHPEDREYVDREWTAALRGEPYDIEHRIIVGDEVKWVRERAELEFDSQGLLKGGFGTAQDITEHKKLDQLKDDFIGLVSHELRSPMTVITGAINTVLTEGAYLSEEETRQLLKDAALESELLSHLLANLLELSRVQAARLVLHTEAIDIKKVVQDAIEEIKRQTSAHQFVVKLPRKLPSVYADPLRLERILYNLLENAVKYSPQGGEIQVSARPQKEHLVIAVSDQGIGISPADQAKLFAPFQRLEEFRPSGVRGAGLGLLVCRRLVEAHGGQIWVKSKPGQGSTFFFTLPLSQGSD